MVWFKVDDGLPMSRKVLSIPKPHRAAAIGVWTLAGCWSAGELTNGYIPDYALEEIPGGRKYAPHLLAAGMWVRVFQGETRSEVDPNCDQTVFEHDGHLFHDWSEYQRNKDDVLKERADHAARQKAYRERMKAKRDAERDGVSDASRDAPVTAARPDPTRTALTTSVNEETYVSSGIEDEPRSKPVRVESGRLARVYCDKVKLSNFGHVASTVSIALAAGYSAEKIGPALERLAHDGRSVTENTLRIEMENADKPVQSGSTQFLTTPNGMHYEVY